MKGIFKECTYSISCRAIPCEVGSTGVLLHISVST